MRPIKFRAWNPNSKRMYIIDVLALWEVTWSCSSENWMSTAYQPHIEVMQFTWLLDKNRKEIYEGDIIQILNYRSSWKNIYTTHIIRYSESHAIFYAQNIHNPEWYWPMWSPLLFILNDKNPEIIWNIYENPELIND